VRGRRIEICFLVVVALATAMTVPVVVVQSEAEASAVVMVKSSRKEVIVLRSVRHPSRSSRPCAGRHGGGTGSCASPVEDGGSGCSGRGRMAKRGRPTKFSVERCERAYSLAAAGATDPEIAEGVGISVATLYLWRHQHPEFLEATRLGKDAADERVERSLYHRALGYSQPAVKIFLPAGASKPIYAPYVERFPPDTAAASLWLRNRRPDEWRDNVKMDVSGTMTLVDLIAQSYQREPIDVTPEASAVASTPERTIEDQREEASLDDGADAVAAALKAPK
jgi:hypothetical protein